MSKPKMPAPPPPPESPYKFQEQERQRQQAELNAIADSKQMGRRSTIVGGQLIAQEEQEGRGLLSQRKRQAARDLVGDA